MKKETALAEMRLVRFWYIYKNCGKDFDTDEVPVRRFLC